MNQHKTHFYLISDELKVPYLGLLIRPKKNSLILTNETNPKYLEEYLQQFLDPSILLLFELDKAARSTVLKKIDSQEKVLISTKQSFQGCKQLLDNFEHLIFFDFYFKKKDLQVYRLEDRQIEVHVLCSRDEKPKFIRMMKNNTIPGETPLLEVNENSFADIINNYKSYQSNVPKMLITHLSKKKRSDYAYTYPSRIVFHNIEFHIKQPRNNFCYYRCGDTKCTGSLRYQHLTHSLAQGKDHSPNCSKPCNRQERTKTMDRVYGFIQEKAKNLENTPDTIYNNVLQYIKANINSLNYLDEVTPDSVENIVRSVRHTQTNGILCSKIPKELRSGFIYFHEAAMCPCVMCSRSDLLKIGLDSQYLIFKRFQCNSFPNALAIYSMEDSSQNLKYYLVAIFFFAEETVDYQFLLMAMELHFKIKRKLVIEIFLDMKLYQAILAFTKSASVVTRWDEYYAIIDRTFETEITDEETKSMIQILRELHFNTDISSTKNLLIQSMGRYQVIQFVIKSYFKNILYSFPESIFMFMNKYNKQPDVIEIMRSIEEFDSDLPILSRQLKLLESLKQILNDKVKEDAFIQITSAKEIMQTKLNINLFLAKLETNLHVNSRITRSMAERLNVIQTNYD